MIVKEYVLEDINPTDCTRDCIYLDIETTGFSRNKNHIILISNGHFVENTFILQQYFAENTGEEKDILQAFADNLPSKNTLVSYNGKAFDLPFINEGFQRNNLSFFIRPDDPQLDLMVMLRSLKKIWDLPRLKLKEAEQYFGISRQDIISGKDSILLYKAYVKKQSPAYLRTILLHNYEDVKHLLLLHKKIMDKLWAESLSICLSSEKITISLFHFTTKKDKGIFYFKILSGQKYIDIYYDNGDTLSTESGNYVLNLFLLQGKDPIGREIYYITEKTLNLPLICQGQVLRDNLYFLIKTKILEIFG